MGQDSPTAAMNIRGFRSVSVQIIWTGADQKTSYFVPEVSNDGQNWCQLVATGSAVRADATNGCCMYGYDLRFAFFRVSFYASTNTQGTFSALCLASGLGAQIDDR